jgi:hypothetical protein
LAECDIARIWYWIFSFPLTTNQQMTLKSKRVQEIHTRLGGGGDDGGDGDNGKWCYKITCI